LLHTTTFAVKSAKADEPVIGSYNNYAALMDEEYQKCEENLLNGIKSDNIGLQTSCAYFLGEM
jgi:hypothetical protein